MNGYVYALINPSLGGQVKIGMTTRTPEERANELSNTTGIPTPFIVGYYESFKNPQWGEKFVHTLLEIKDKRVAPNREFFHVSLKEAIDAIIDAKRYEQNDGEDDTTQNAIYAEPSESIFNIPYVLTDYGVENTHPGVAQISMALDCLNEDVNGFVDTTGAKEYIQKAIALGLVTLGHELTVEIFELENNATDNSGMQKQYEKLLIKGVNLNSNICRGKLCSLYKETDKPINSRCELYKTYLLTEIERFHEQQSFESGNDKTDLFSKYLCDYYILCLAHDIPHDESTINDFLSAHCDSISAWCRFSAAAFKA
jgi:hypothetical protein